MSANHIAQTVLELKAARGKTSVKVTQWPIINNPSFKPFVVSFRAPGRAYFGHSAFYEWQEAESAARNLFSSINQMAA